MESYNIAAEAFLSWSARSDKANENFSSSAGVKSAGLPFTRLPFMRWYNHWRDFPK